MTESVLKTSLSARRWALLLSFAFPLAALLFLGLLRSDNGLVFTSRIYTRLVRSYGLRQEFITPHCPQQNGMVEQLIRSLKEQCVHPTTPRSTTGRSVA